MSCVFYNLVCSGQYCICTKRSHLSPDTESVGYLQNRRPLECGGGLDTGALFDQSVWGHLASQQGAPWSLEYETKNIFFDAFS